MAEPEATGGTPREGYVTFPKLGDWSLRAQCFLIGLDPDLFFPSDDRPGANTPPREVVECCAECSVQRACRDYALETGVQGYWGGTTARERRRMRKRETPIRRLPGPVSVNGSLPACPSCHQQQFVVRQSEERWQCLDCEARWPAVAS